MTSTIIIGCGIAGPALALGLKKCGINCTIYESEKNPEENKGLYLYLGPNGVNVLKTLEIEEQVRKNGYPCNNMVFENHKGKAIAQVNTDEDEKKYGTYGIIIKRGVFQKVLREELELNDIQINWNKKLADITNDEHVSAKFEDGDSVQGDCIIGCDGLHSRTRKFVLPDGPEPNYTGIVVAGAISNIEEKPSSNILSFHFGEKSYMNYFVNNDNEAMWGAYVTIEKNSLSEIKSLSQEEWKQKILELYENDASYITEFVKNGNILTKLPLFDLEPLPVWHNGKVCLVGDSAHATTPHAGQGASLALESAITLTKCLRDTDNTQEAFSKYQSLRKPRVEKMIQMARRQGEMFTEVNPVKKWVRNKILSSMIKKGNKQFDEIYGYKIPWDEKITLN